MLLKMYFFSVFQKGEKNWRDLDWKQHKDTKIKLSPVASEILNFRGQHPIYR